MRKKSPALFFLALLPAAGWTANTLTITEKAGIVTNDYPVQIGRPFAEGEISGCPQVLLDGVPAPHQQVAVKSRWGGTPAGGVKHAIFSFYIPTLNAGGAVTVSFQNGAGSGTCEGTALTPAQMLDDASYNFDARMEFAGDVTGAVSARTMLADGRYETWLAGPKATSLILADHSATAVYDMGMNRAFRPIFHATFWPRIGKVHVRFIGEIANTERLQDLTYAITSLATGHNGPTTVYTKPSFLHHGRSRWTKDFWIGGAPPKVSIDHNIAYLAATKALPNFDTSITVPAQALTDSYAQWTGASKDLFDAGNWVKYMGQTGGRDDIGPYPTWTLQWLYSGDWRMAEKAFGNADLAAAWTMHFREGALSRKIMSYDGLGKILSVTGRPSILLGNGIQYQAGDEIIPTGPLTNGNPNSFSGWFVDAQHQPAPFYPQYLLSGDYWCLEEMYFWASWSAAYLGKASATGWEGYRGPTGREGGISGSPRGQAWVFRSRVETAFIAPDGTPEKEYFDRLSMDALANWEGSSGITGTAFQGTPMWTWANTRGLPRYGPSVPATRFIRAGDGFNEKNFIASTTTVKSVEAPWMVNFLIYSLGRARELGYPADPMLMWMSGWLFGQTLDPAYDPYLIATYVMPVTDQDSVFFNDWATVKGRFSDPFISDGRTYTHEAWFNSNLGLDHGYGLIAATAASMAARHPGGQDAWNWFKSHAYDKVAFSSNPKWAILPREINSAPFNGGAPGLTPPARPRRLRDR
jgi:hypothetical protein